MTLSVQTVLGAIAPEEMGFTLPHEHLFWDLGFYLDKSVDPSDPCDVRNAPLTMDQLGNLRYHMYEYRDNLVQTDVDTAAQELIWYRECGGGTICDNSAVGMGRFPEKIREAVGAQRCARRPRYRRVLQLHAAGVDGTHG